MRKLSQFVLMEGWRIVGENLSCQRVHGLQAWRSYERKWKGIAAKFFLHQGLGFPARSVLVIRMFLHVQCSKEENILGKKLNGISPMELRHLNVGMKNVLCYNSSLQSGDSPEQFCLLWDRE